MSNTIPTVPSDFEKSLLDALEESGLQYFEVEINGKQPGFEITISGGLDQFIEAMKSLAQKIVFYESTVFDEDDFYVNSYGADDDDEEERLDLRDVDGQLKKFNQRLGEVCLINLVCIFGANAITMPYAASWYDDFLMMKIKAQGEIEEKSETQAVARRIEAEEVERRVLDVIKKLRKDQAIIDRVVRAKATQRALISHISETVPGAGSLARATLAAAVTTLRDGILMDAG